MFGFKKSDGIRLIRHTEHDAGHLTNRNRLTFFGFVPIVDPNLLERYRLHPNNDSGETFCSLLD